MVNGEAFKQTKAPEISKEEIPENLILDLKGIKDQAEFSAYVEEHVGSDPEKLSDFLCEFIFKSSPLSLRSGPLPGFMSTLSSEQQYKLASTVISRHGILLPRLGERHIFFPSLTNREIAHLIIEQLDTYDLEEGKKYTYFPGVGELEFLKELAPVEAEPIKEKMLLLLKRHEDHGCPPGIFGDLFGIQTPGYEFFPEGREYLVRFIQSQDSFTVDRADAFLENLESYYTEDWVPETLKKSLVHYSVASKFVLAAPNAVWKNEDWVPEMIEFSKEIIEEHGARINEGEGFVETDPFAEHPWRFTEEQAHLTTALLGISNSNNEKLSELGLSKEEWEPFIGEVNERINSAYQQFVERSPSFWAHQNKDDIDSFDEAARVKVAPLRENIRAFVIRYLVQSTEKKEPRLEAMRELIDGIDHLINEGAKKYQKIHEVDIPLYDKLYEEFDTLRETGRYPLEVYLGRDGVYAYIGRHAQDVARRRKLGLAGRKKLRAGGEVVEINPQYIVYPRYFRDNLNYKTKREFLEQESVSPEADPLFYDTGYTGTIPEQIMRIMDFDETEIERRIRLLSAPSAHRRVKGIPENARSEIIEYIEHNVKTEESAEGLIKDPKSGKIRPIAKPTSPEEQFYFSMVKQAIGRHYWIQEQLHHEPSGNVNLDSERHMIRIREEYASLLPEGFKSDPQTYLKSHGELLKGSKGKGEYPDEEITIFSLSDGTEIVAKRIELRKAKEARKEFSILIAAKKAGLPTAEPVGFLSGKDATDGSYLLMNKVEGISGRKFEKHLRESGKYSEDQLGAILQIVATKNREIAEIFRNTLHIDKRWRIKDTIIEFNEDTGEVEAVIPIDWERAESFDPSDPKEID